MFDTSHATNNTYELDISTTRAYNTNPPGITTGTPGQAGSALTYEIPINIGFGTLIVTMMQYFSL